MAIAIYTSFGAEIDSNGTPLNGGTVTVYDAGTTTPRAIYTDTALSVAATNPIPLNSAGRHDQGMVYTAATAYKVVVKDSGGSTIYTRDNIDPGVPIGTGVVPIENGGTNADNAATALVNLGAATTAQITSLAEEVAELAGAVGSTASTQIATGTTAQRPTDDLAEGMIRRNTTTHRTEGYNNAAAWESYLTDTEIATQTEMETGTDVTKVVTPGRQHYHDSACKAWARISVSGGTPTLAEGYNISGTITDHGAGDFTIAFTTALSTANYAVVAMINNNAAPSYQVHAKLCQTTDIRLFVTDGSGNAVDNISFSVVVFGDI